MQKFYVYIIQSEKTNGYYIGQTQDVEIRLEKHNSFDNTEYTLRDQPWKLCKYFICDCRIQARRIEQHIKRMKSKKYIDNLMVYDNIFQKLKQKYLCI